MSKHQNSIHYEWKWEENNPSNNNNRWASNDNNDDGDGEVIHKYLS